MNADIVMATAFLLLPPILIFAFQNRLRAFIYSFFATWLLLIAGGQYHLAYTPDYESFAPAISIFAGWIPALVFSGIWLGVVTLMIRGKSD